MRVLTAPSARRIALAAQGFGRPRPAAVTMRHVQWHIHRLAQFQIDSINVLERAHYFPLFSRVGPYDTALLDRAFGRSPRRLFEFWGHAASLIDVRIEPALRWRMRAAAEHAWANVRRIRQENPALVDRVHAEVADRGPISARQIEWDPQRRRDHWGWNWSDSKTALEWLFHSGEVTSATRNAQFERLYDLPARVLPRAVHECPALPEDEAHVELVRRAAAALGVASQRCLADYFRTKSAPTRAAIAALEASGELEPVSVPGWPPHWLWHGARRPRRVRTRALISPFDSLIFERSRAQRLFGLDYRIEIYVPADRRRYGYYVYPFLLDESFVARVDLKADRTAGTLLVQSAWIEPGDHDATRVAAELAAALEETARWQGLDRVAVNPRGDLAAALSVAVRDCPAVARPR